MLALCPLWVVLLSVEKVFWIPLNSIRSIGLNKGIELDFSLDAFLFLGFCLSILEECTKQERVYAARLGYQLLSLAGSVAKSS
jgi:hypothetical protein